MEDVPRECSGKRERGGQGCVASVDRSGGAVSEPTMADKAFQAYLESGGKLNLLREWVRAEIAEAVMTYASLAVESSRNERELHGSDKKR